MKKAAIIALVLGIVAAGVVWRMHHARTPHPVEVAGFESDMTEGLLRGIFPELKNASVCFVAFGEDKTEPSWAFITRFADSHPPVKSFKSSVFPPGGKILEVSTGRVGVIIQIISFKEFIPGTFDVLVALSTMPPGHDRFVYRVSNATGEWIIKSRKLE
jgi:hypothetical protein